MVKKIFSIFILGITLLSLITSVHAFDESLVASCGGDDNLIIGCLGDEDLGATSYIAQTASGNIIPSSEEKGIELFSLFEIDYNGTKISGEITFSIILFLLLIIIYLCYRLLKSKKKNKEEKKR